MNGSAIVMMLISTMTIWGGLVLAMMNLARNKEDDGGDFEID